MHISYAPLHGLGPKNLDEYDDKQHKIFYPKCTMDVFYGDVQDVLYAPDGSLHKKVPARSGQLVRNSKAILEHTHSERTSQSLPLPLDTGSSGHSIGHSSRSSGHSSGSGSGSSSGIGNSSGSGSSGIGNSSGSSNRCGTHSRCRVHLRSMDELIQSVEQIFVLHGLQRQPGGVAGSQRQIPLRKDSPPTVFANEKHSMTVSFLPLGQWLIVYADERSVKLGQSDGEETIKVKVGSILIQPVLYNMAAPSLDAFPDEINGKIGIFLDLTSMGHLETAVKSYKVQEPAFKEIFLNLSRYSGFVRAIPGTIPQDDDASGANETYRSLCKQRVVEARRRYGIIFRPEWDGELTPPYPGHDDTFIPYRCRVPGGSPWRGRRFFAPPRRFITEEIPPPTGEMPEFPPVPAALYPPIGPAWNYRPPANPHLYPPWWNNNRPPQP